MHSLGPIEVVDYHVAGAPFRVVTSGFPQVRGTDPLARVGEARNVGDDLRRLLVNEPRGHDGLHGGYAYSPGHSGADLEAVFFHQAGYSTVSGRGTIALVTWAIESGLVPADAPQGPVTLDTPAGTVEANARISNGRVESVSFRNVTSYVAGRFIPMQLADGVVPVDIAYGGAYYAAVDVGELDLVIAPGNLDAFVRYGREIGAILADNPAVVHPTDHRLSGLTATIFYEDVEVSGPGRQQRSVTVSTDGRVDRSPCGGGTSARVALLDNTAELARGDALVNESFVGGRFSARVVGDGEVGGIHGVVTEVEGRAFRTGVGTYWLDEDDPIGFGYQLV
jgi:proline racemase